jgi:dTDP-3-amino-3,4,6-trideoxy-alpha-D-glucose transaminase
VSAVDIPLTKLDNSDPALMEELLGAVERVARSAAFILGSEVEEFEAELASYCETSEAVGVASGTDALALSLRALGVGQGDEVVLPANTFIATAEAVSMTGATPRLVDVDPDTHLLTAQIVERAIGPRTACVIPVHLYGRTVDMDPLIAVARRAGIAIVEDACQAHGARYRGRRVGSLGDCGCFSFYPAKNLGAWGDGGAVVTNDPELAERVRLLRAHGESPRYHHHLVGFTSRLDAIHAAVLRVKLRRLDEANDARRRVAARLTQLLDGASVRTPAPAGDGMDHVFHQYVVECDDRDALRDHLAAHGIGSGIHYPVPIHRSGAYAGLGLGPGSLPTVERLAERICSLPMFPAMSDEQTARVAAAVTAFAPVSSAWRAA